MRLWTVPMLLLASFASSQEAAPPQISGELSLRDAVTTGLRSNPRLQAARQELEATRAAARTAKALKSPELSANLFGSTGNQQSILRGSPGVEPTAPMRVPPDQVAIANLMLMVPLYTGGRLEGLIGRAEALEAAAAGQVEEVAAEVALSVTEAYFQVLLGLELIQAERARVDALTEALRNARAQFEAGRGIEASVMRAKAELAEAQRDLLSAENEREKALLDLKEAMGVELGSEISIGQASELTPPYSTLDEWLQAARANRGVLDTASARVQAARAATNAAEGALKPQVYGTAMADRMSSDMGTESGYTLGITLSMPLFDGGMRKSEAQEMRNMRQAAEAMLREVELSVSKQVRQAWLDLQTALANTRSAEESLESAESAYEVIALRVESGKGILLERLDALESLTRARSQLATSRFAYQIAAARLERAAGSPPSLTGEQQP